MRKIKLLGLTLVLLEIGCTPISKVTTSWKAENVTPQKYNKILVLGLINEPDRTIREKMEAYIVSDLKSMGYNAVCSCDEFSPKEFENLSEKQALDKLGNNAIDAVLTIVLLNKERERYYVPGRVYYSPYAVYQGRFWGYYRTMYGRVYEPGYYTVNTKYFWESNFYSLGGKELLYSAQSHSFDPGSTKVLANDYGQMIVKDMVKQNVISNQGNTAGKSF